MVNPAAHHMVTRPNGRGVPRGVWIPHLADGGSEALLNVLGAGGGLKLAQYGSSAAVRVSPQGGGQAVVVVAPTIAVTSATHNSITISITGGSGFDTLIPQIREGAGSYSSRTGISPSATSYTYTGLDDETEYTVRLRAEQGEAFEYSNTQTADTDEDTGIPTNAERIAAIIGGYTPPWDYTQYLPADPVTTREVTVTTVNGFNNEAAVPGTKIFIGADLTGTLSISASDIDIVAYTNDVHRTITGKIGITIGQSRIRWTGGNYIDHTPQNIIWRRVSDVLFDNVYCETAFYINLDGGIGGRRIAWVNCTLDLRPVENTGEKNFPWFGLQGSQGAHTDWFILNCKSERALAGIELGHACTRLQTCDRAIIADSAFGMVGNDGNDTGIRISVGSRIGWIKNCYNMGRMHFNFMDPLAYSAQDYLLDGLIQYRDFNQVLLQTGTINTGEVRNHTLYSAGPSGQALSGISPMSTGSGNSLTLPWNGVSRADVSHIGAQR